MYSSAGTIILMLRAIHRKGYSLSEYGIKLFKNKSPLNYNPMSPIQCALNVNRHDSAMI